MSKEMKLWNKVCETDPSITKHVNQRGGFTAIDAQSQIKQATMLWGPYGTNWGLWDLSINLIYDKDGSPINMYLTASFNYPTSEDELLKITSFPIAADMPFKANDDCVKKLQTECISKALSRLGFNSDVFEGKFDDNKYVSELKKKYNEESQPDLLPYICDEYEKIAGVPVGTVESLEIKQAIIREFGKLPSNKDSIPLIIEKLPPKVILGIGCDVAGLEDEEVEE